MITAYAKIPTFETPYVLSVFPIQDRNAGKGGRTAFAVSRENAKFVRVIRDIKADPAVGANTTTRELYSLYPRLKTMAREVLWRTPVIVNWDLENPLAIIGCTMYRETPKSKTICINIGKAILRF